MKKILMALCLLLCFALAGCDVLEELTPDPSDRQTEQTADAPAETQTDVPAEETTHPRAYLVVTVADAVYEPIPLTEPGRYTVTRGEHINVIEVTEDSVCMAESTCDNQDCIYQGTVTLENKDERVLQHMILCLPNEVILELYTYEELQQLMPDWLEAQAQ